MEQQDTSASSPPPANHRDSLPARLNDPSASLPAPTPTSKSTFTSTPPPQTSLSASEPTLRFPRPLGNRRLANWVSSSNPDIMRLTTTTEDTGLSESTYELISGGNTDTESQDGNYAESISESVSSLDLRRPDDVHSLAGTEQTYDDESVIDDSEIYRPVTPDHDDEDDDDEMNEDAVLAESQTTNEPTGVQSLSESEHEALSRSSLEYTQQSLKTPSLPPSPDASRLVERVVGQPYQFAPEIEQTTWNKRMAKFWDTKARVQDYILEATSAALPGLIFVVAIALVLPVFHSPSTLDPLSPLSTTTNAPMATAVVATTATSQTAASTCSTSDMRPNPTSAGGVGLIPVGEVASDEWRFGAKKPVVSFTAQARNDILIHIPRSIKQTWLAKDCLTVTAKRGDGHVDTTMASVDEGILLKFAKKEAHGVVSLFLEAKCRPKVHKVVKVHFGKGIMEEAYERTKLLAHDLSGLVPAAAQEAERCIEGAKRSLGSVCQNVCLNIQSASDTMAKTFGTTFLDTRQNLGSLATNALARIKGATEEITNKIDTATQQATQKLPVVQDVQNQLQLQLLDAQISAKIWWLQATGRQEEGHEYQRKAKSFVAKKHAAAEEARQTRSKGHEKLTEPASRPWSKIVGKGQCQRSTDRKGRSVQHCKAQA